MIFVGREGVTLDSVLAPIRTWVITPKTSLPFALVVSAADILHRFAPATLQTLSENPTLASFFHYTTNNVPLQRSAWAVATFGLALATNAYLNRQVTNNWVKDETYDWNKEIVLITGAAGGIGESVAKQFIKRNPRTRIVVVDFAKLTWTPPAGSRVYYYQCDLTDLSAIKSMGDKVREEVGDPTVLFNNAGLGRVDTVMEGNHALVDKIIRTNLTAQFYVTQEFLTSMVRNNHGHIIYSSSMSSVIASPMITTYSATKAGLSALHDGLQMELKYFHGADKVRQTLGIFAFIRTPMTRGASDGSFVIPLLNVESVGERIVDEVYTGYGTTIYMPGAMTFITTLRGGPTWLFSMVRSGAAKMLHASMKKRFVEQMKKPKEERKFDLR